MTVQGTEQNRLSSRDCSRINGLKRTRTGNARTDSTSVGRYSLIALTRRIHHVVNLRAEHSTDGFMQTAALHALAQQMRMFCGRFVTKARKQRHIVQLIQRQSPERTPSSISCAL